ncbi:MAG: tripartite tricarboxylate transporter TctB family protein [Pseudomonadota bacterium]
MTSHIREWIIALIPLSFSLLTIFYLIPNQIELTDEYARRSLSPAFYPELSAWIIALLSVLLIIKRFRRPVQRAEEEGAGLSRGEEVRVGIAFVIALFFAFCFAYIGFLPATFFTLILFFILQEIKKPFKLFCLSAAATVGVYLFFRYGMKVHFPPGIWIK